MSNTSNPTTVAPRVYTIGQFRAMGGPCHALVYLKIKAGKLRIVKDGRRTLITAAEVDRYFKALEAGSAA